MATECYYCRNFKKFNCLYCGMPLCDEHFVLVEGIEKSNVFCNRKCFLSYIKTQ